MRKKILLIAIILAGTFSAGTVAQNNRSGNCPQKECSQMQDSRKNMCPFDGLNLTDAQKAQLQTLNEQMRTSRKEIMKERKENAQQIKAGREAMQTKYNEGLKKILTPEQYTQYLEKRLKMMNGMKGDRSSKKGNDYKKGRQCPPGSRNTPAQGN